MKKNILLLLITTIIFSFSIPTLEAFSDNNLTEHTTNATIASLKVFTDDSMTQELKNPNQYIYPKEVTLYFEGEASVDGNIIESGEKISSPGVHNLKITNGSNTKYYNFSIINNINGKNIISFSSRGNSTGVVDEDGNLYTWGDNNEGRLGDNSTKHRTTPVKINGKGDIKKDTKIISISLGFTHSMALDSNGNLYTWGNNTSGQLGNGSNKHRHTPMKINGKGDIKENSKIIRISGGYYSSSALDTDGNLYTWGENNYGEIGNGTTSNIYIPVMINGKGDIKENSKIIDIVSGKDSKLALDINGNLYTWGRNNYGQLGDGTNINRNLPVKINSKGDIDNSIKITSISGYSSYGAVDNTGNLYSWGNNTSGQLGDGSNTNRNVPIKINGKGDIKENTKIVSVSYFDNASSAIDTNGNLYTWGNNTSGQLGDGSNTNRNVPIKINGKGDIKKDTKIISSSFGTFSSSALDTDGNLYTWGNNDRGQLGNGTNINELTPINTSLTINYDVKRRSDSQNIYFDIITENIPSNMKIAYRFDNKGTYLFQDIINGTTTLTIPKATNNILIELNLAMFSDGKYKILENLNSPIKKKLLSLDVTGPQKEKIELNLSKKFDAIKFAKDNFKISNSQGKVTITTDINKVNIDKIGTILINYTIKDSSGSSVYHKLNLEVIDTISPKFKKFDKNISLNQHEPFDILSGILATDNSGIIPTITAELNGKELTGNFDTSKPGKFTIKYKATDSSGNSTTTTRNIEIKDTKIVFNNARFTTYGFYLDGQITDTAKYFDKNVETFLLIKDSNGNLKSRKKNNQFSEPNINGYSKFQTTITSSELSSLQGLKNATLQIEVKDKNESLIYDFKMKNYSNDLIWNEEIIKAEGDDWSLESTNIQDLPACEYEHGIIRLRANKNGNILFSILSRPEIITAINDKIYTQSYGIVLDGKLSKIDNYDNSFTGSFIIKNSKNKIIFSKSFKAIKNSENKTTADFQIILGKVDFAKLGEIKNGKMEIIIDGNSKSYPFKSNLKSKNIKKRPTITISPDSHQSQYFSATNIPIIKYDNNTIDINHDSNGNILISNTIDKGVTIRTISRDNDNKLIKAIAISKEFEFNNAHTKTLNIKDTYGNSIDKIKTSDIKDEILDNSKPNSAFEFIIPSKYLNDNFKYEIILSNNKGIEIDRLPFNIYEY